MIRTSQLKRKKNPFKNVNCCKKCDILEGKQQKTNQKLTIRTTSTKITTTKSISFMTEIIFIVVKQKTEKYTLTQNGPQSALTIWRYTSEKKIRDCLVDTWKPIQLFIGKLGNFLAKCLCICWKLQKILFIFKKKHTNISTKILKTPKTNGTDFSAKMRFKRKIKRKFI